MIKQSKNLLYISSFLPILAAIFFIVGCVKRQISYKSIDQKIPLFITIPKNRLVHHHITTKFYNILWNQLASNYNLRKVLKGNYMLNTKIISLNYPHKFVSPDVVLHGYRMSINILCELFDKDHRTIKAKKEMCCYNTVHSSNQPLFHQEFFMHSLKTLFERMAVKIDHWLRRILKKKR